MSASWQTHFSPRLPVTCHLTSAKNMIFGEKAACVIESGDLRFKVTAVPRAQTTCFPLKGFNHWWSENVRDEEEEKQDLSMYYRHFKILFQSRRLLKKRKDTFILTWINEQLWLLADWVISPWTELDHWPHTLHLPTLHWPNIALINALTTADALATN